MEAVGNDAGVWEPASDQGPVGAGEVDADDTDPLAACNAAIKSWSCFGLRPGSTSKTLWFLRSAKVVANRVALWRVCSSMPKTEGALEAQAFAGLAGRELVVNALDGGSS